jgi:hypothetical protein
MALPAPTSIVEISYVEEQQAHQQMYKNKVVLIFQIQFSARQVQYWLIYYNHRGHCHLTYHSKLKNSMFVVQLESTTEIGYQERLIAQSPLTAREVCASVNRYCRDFHSSNPIGSLHLVTVYIRPADAEVQYFLRKILGGIRTVERKRVLSAPGTKDQLNVLFQTTQQDLPDKLHLRCGGGEKLITLDYKSTVLRCQHCFYYRHLPEHCATVNSAEPTRGRSKTHESPGPEHCQCFCPRSRETSPQCRESSQHKKEFQRERELQRASAIQADRQTHREQDSLRSQDESWYANSQPLEPTSRTRSGPLASARVEDICTPLGTTKSAAACHTNTAAGPLQRVKQAARAQLPQVSKEIKKKKGKNTVKNKPRKKGSSAPVPKVTQWVPRWPISSQPTPKTVSSTTTEETGPSQEPSEQLKTLWNLPHPLPNLTENSSNLPVKLNRQPLGRRGNSKSSPPKWTRTWRGL